MFRHCVMVKFTEDATPEQRQAVLDGVNGLPGKIPEIVSYVAGFDAGLNADNHEFVVVADFATQADYEIYASHPDHLQVVTDFIKPVVADRSAVQYEY